MLILSLLLGPATHMTWNFLYLASYKKCSATGKRNSPISYVSSHDLLGMPSFFFSWYTRLLDLTENVLTVLWSEMKALLLAQQDSGSLWLYVRLPHWFLAFLHDRKTKSAVGILTKRIRWSVGESGIGRLGSRVLCCSQWECSYVFTYLSSTHIPHDITCDHAMNECITVQIPSILTPVISGQSLTLCPYALTYTGGHRDHWCAL